MWLWVWPMEEAPLLPLVNGEPNPSGPPRTGRVCSCFELPHLAGFKLEPLVVGAYIMAHASGPAGCKVAPTR